MWVTISRNHFWPLPHHFFLPNSETLVLFDCSLEEQFFRLPADLSGIKPDEALSSLDLHIYLTSMGSAMSIKAANIQRRALECPSGSLENYFSKNLNRWHKYTCEKSGCYWGVTVAKANTDYKMVRMTQTLSIMFCSYKHVCKCCNKSRFHKISLLKPHQVSLCTRLSVVLLGWAACKW